MAKVVTEAQMRRMAKAWESLYGPPAGAELLPDGTFRVFAKTEENAQAGPEGGDECDPDEVFG